MQTHAKSLVESYGNSYYTTSDRNCRMHVTSFPCSLPLVLFLGAFGPQHQEGETAGRMQVAGRGWGRTPGAALGGGARQDGTVSVDDSPVMEDTEGREELKWPLTPWSAKDFVPQKTQFSIFFSINILSFVDHLAFARTTQPCWCRAKAATDNSSMNGHGYVPIKLDL